MHNDPESARGRHVEPLRHQSAHGAQRQALVDLWDDVSRRRDELDAQLARLARERHELQRERADLRERIWPRWLRGRGRRLQAVDAADQALPPLPEQPQLCWGRGLRAILLRILRDFGSAVSLVEIHRSLHLLGVAVDSEHPAKALSDALGYEVEQGRAERVVRGRYRVPAG